MENANPATVTVQPPACHHHQRSLIHAKFHAYSPVRHILTKCDYDEKKKKKNSQLLDR
ncbi:hypothetical protein X777_09625 [Ooceraea biroi]|uniref:Uncharacterized protein n=1 Tax=Ooceraea biroi TaxID=2015173 RepID=A0A026W6Z4_OOCBI|nr:hypothetical protein X777_09625 [Ooceraea biroi]